MIQPVASQGGTNTNLSAETETRKVWIRGYPLPDYYTSRVASYSPAGPMEAQLKRKRFYCFLSVTKHLSLPISHVFTATDNRKPDRVGCYRLYAAPKSTEKILLDDCLEVDGARAGDTNGYNHNNTSTSALPCLWTNRRR